MPNQPTTARDPAAEVADLRTRLLNEEQKLRAVREIGIALASTLDLDRLLALIMDKVTELLGADRSTLYLMTDDGRGLWSKIAQGGATETIRLQVGEGIAGWVAQSGETVNIPEAYDDPRFQKDVDRISGYRTRTILCMPIRNHVGRIVSVVQVLNKIGGRFTAEDEALLTTLGTQAAISIENSKLYQSVVQKNVELLETQEKLQQKMYELDVLFEIQQEMQQALTLDEMLGKLLVRTAELGGAEAGALLLRESNTDVFYVSRVGDPNGRVQQMALPSGDSILGWVATEGATLVLSDPKSDPRYHSEIWASIGMGEPHSLVCVPLHSKEGALGAIGLVNKEGGERFGGGEVKLLTLIAGQVAKTVELERNKEERLRQSRLAALGQALSGVLHDLKTPMTIISGYAQLMAHMNDAEQRAKYVTQILMQFDHMDAMAREILAFARGESTLLIRKVYLQSFLEEMLAHLGPTFEGSGIELVTEIEYRGVAYFDETKLRRVIQNIARNAIEAMSGTPSAVFRFGTRLEGSSLVFSFEDNGPGIPVDLEGRLFEVFATSGKKDGTGLGLAIVKRIVEEHDGSIEYQTKAGQGTTFIVRLPLERPGEDKKKSRRR